MKNFAVILFLTLVGFSVSAPSWERQGEDTYPICQNGSDCNDGCCSPFYACSHYHGFTISEPQSGGSALVRCNFNPTPYSQPHLSLFCGNIWQPPKIG